MRELKEISEIETGKIILLFSAPWCGDCIVLEMYIDQIINENKEYEFIKVDSDKFPLLAKDYNIFGIPSFVALNDGEVIGDYIDKNSKPKDKIQQWIDSLK